MDISNGKIDDSDGETDNPDGETDNSDGEIAPFSFPPLPCPLSPATGGAAPAQRARARACAHTCLVKRVTRRQTGQAALLGWLNQSIIQRVFVDAVCGDGLCRSAAAISSPIDRLTGKLVDRV
jgi:hypothetical protein